MVPEAFFQVHPSPVAFAGVSFVVQDLVAINQDFGFGGIDTSAATCIHSPFTNDRCVGIAVLDRESADSRFYESQDEYNRAKILPIQNGWIQFGVDQR